MISLYSDAENSLSYTIVIQIIHIWGEKKGIKNIEELLLCPLRVDEATILRV